MPKLFDAFVESMYWLKNFLSPVLVGAFIGLIIYIKNEDLLWLSIVIASIGLIAGVLFAERIRKKYGSSGFMSKLFGSSNVFPGESTEDKEEQEKRDKTKGKG